MRFPTSGARRTMVLFLLLTALASLAAACGSSAAAPAGAAAPAEGQAVGGDGSTARSGATGGPAAPGVGVTGSNGGNGGKDAAFRDDAKIIRTGSLQLDVKDVKTSLRSARDTIVGMGGYVGASQQSSDGTSIVATVTYRIPVDRWEEALDALRALGDEVGEQTDAAEVTDQIVDLGARIRNLQASETALVRHAADAAKISDLLEIETRLTDVRGQIEQLTAQQKNLQDQAAYATLAVTFGTEVAAVTKAAEQWDPKNEVDRAGASLIGFLQTLTTAGIWFAIVWLPVLTALAIVVGIGIFIARRLGFLRRSDPPLPPAPAEG
jgi:CRP-like cAMP-binding protein